MQDAWLPDSPGEIPERGIAPVSAEAGGIRVSDAEREHAAHIVEAAMSEGMLTFDEGDQRLAAAYAARVRRELDAVTADLPVHQLAPRTIDSSKPLCASCAARAASPAQLALTAARMAATRSRAAAVLIPLLFMVMAMATVALGWAVLHDPSFGYHHPPNWGR